MAIVFHRGLAVPLWAAVFGGAALSTPRGMMPSLLALVGLAAVACTIPPIVRWLRPSRSVVIDDAADLVRMDDDGGWQAALAGSPAQPKDQRLRSRRSPPSS